MLKISTAPHMQTQHDTPKIMLDVVFAMLPAIIVALIFFGLPALMVILTSVAACCGFEYFANRFWFKKGNTTTDFSAIVTGMLLAFNLPSSMPLWMVVVGAFVAIVIGKLCYGGLGKNIFNPALVGRVFLFISFPVQMTNWPKPEFLNFLNTDAQTGATTLGLIKHIDSQTSATMLAGELPSYWQMFIGNIGGCLGEVSALALLLGLVYMLYRKVITWHIPFYYIGSFFSFSLIMWLITGNIQYEPLTNILSGGLMLGAIFMATDYTTSPMTIKGRIIFAVCCGVLTGIIRFFSAYPEGVSFAILIMNAFVPLIDKFIKPDFYGQRR
ncbi:MAG: RnfABCDGE type electron transport complex subunit D [Alphaproteobacteria bacterium]|nr:RnfABCDGE type electron transport complex subunit D [Alphaproteobacteria bacterium]